MNYRTSRRILSKRFCLAAGMLSVLMVGGADRVYPAEPAEKDRSRSEIPSGLALPDWFNRNRVQLHWEGPLLHVVEDGTPDKSFATWIKRVQDRIVAMRPAVTVGLAKRAGEGAWWPSSVGQPFPEAKDRNIYKEFFLDPMQSQGIHYIAYYRHDIDTYCEEQHPEWRSLDADRRPIPNHDRGGDACRLCFNSPYRDFVRTRLVELAEQGTSGVYFDQDHMNEICTCDFCRQRFRASRGYSMPDTLKPYTAEYLDAAKFVGETIFQTFAEWRAAVKAVNPNMVLIAGADELVTFAGIHHPESLSDSIDSLKSEFQKCFGGQQHFPGAPLRGLLRASPEYYSPPRSQQESLAWIIARDAGGGRPAHIWNHKPDKDFGETFHTNMALVAHGNISSASVEVVAKEHSYNELFALSKLLGNEFADAKPYRWAVVYISSAIKEHSYPANGDASRSYKQTFEQLYAPVLAATDVLQRDHVPWGTVFDKDLKKGSLSPFTKVVIAPSADLLSAELQASLARVEAQGVAVIRLSSKDPWYVAKAVPKLQEDLVAEITAKGGLPPIQVQGSRDVRVNYFSNHGGAGILVTAVRDWNNFWFFGDDQASRRALLPETEPVAGMNVIIRDSTIRVERARIIDVFDSTPVDQAVGGGVLSLPPFPIYQFLQCTLKQ